MPALNAIRAVLLERARPPEHRAGLVNTICVLGVAVAGAHAPKVQAEVFG